MELKDLNGKFRQKLTNLDETWKDLNGKFKRKLKKCFDENHKKFRRI